MADELNSFLPAFDYVLIDLGTIEKKLPQLHSDYARLTGILLQYSRRKRALMRILDTHAQLVRNLIATDSGRAFVSTTLVYLNWASQLTTVEVITIFERISTEAAEIVMSAAQTWINEGIEQGIERGVRGMLKLGMDAVAIAAALDIPQTKAERLIEKIRKDTK